MQGSDDERRRQIIPVAHQVIDGGLSVPHLEPFFSPPFAVKSIQISDRTYDALGRHICYRAYFQAVPAATHLTPWSIEFALFCVNSASYRFVDIDRGDAVSDYLVMKCVCHKQQLYCET